MFPTDHRVHAPCRLSLTPDLAYRKWPTLVDVIIFEAYEVEPAQWRDSTPSTELIHGIQVLSVAEMDTSNVSLLHPCRSLGCPRFRMRAPGGVKEA